jgi:putative ABC transport system permease protein
MTTLRWKKVIRDLWVNRSRSLMAVLAMTIGVIGIGAVLCAYAILVRELDANYARTNPPSATITVQPTGADLVKEVQHLPGIGEAEARGLFQARIRLKTDNWKTLLLFVIDDFRTMRIATSTPEEGDWPPRAGEILIERAAFRVIGARIGDAVTVRLPGVGQQNLRVSGSIHDPAQAPAWMEGLIYGYVTRETFALFGPIPLNEVLLTVAERPFDKARIRSTVKTVTDWMDRQSYRVQRIDVPEPGHHPHQTQLKALLFLLEAFGALCFLLSTVLVITLIGAIMAQQTRQVGVIEHGPIARIGCGNRRRSVIRIGGPRLCRLRRGYAQFRNSRCVGAALDVPGSCGDRPCDPSRLCSISCLPGKPHHGARGHYRLWDQDAGEDRLTL